MRHSCDIWVVSPKHLSVRRPDHDLIKSHLSKKLLDMHGAAGRKGRLVCEVQVCVNADKTSPGRRSDLPSSRGLQLCRRCGQYSRSRLDSPSQGVRDADGTRTRSSSNREGQSQLAFCRDTAKHPIEQAAPERKSLGSVRLGNNRRRRGAPIANDGRISDRGRTDWRTHAGGARALVLQRNHESGLAAAAPYPVRRRRQCHRARKNSYGFHLASVHIGTI